MADSCSDIYAAIARLEAKIDSIPRVNEQSIIDRAIEGSKALLSPEIGAAAAIGFVATKKADNAAALGASLAGKIFTLAATVLGLVAAAGVYGVLSNRIGKLEDKVNRQEGIVDQIIAEVKRVGQEVFNVGNNLRRLERFVGQVALTLNRTTKLANEAIKKADQAEYDSKEATKKADSAIKKADVSITNSIRAFGKAGEAERKANQAQNTANQAFNKAAIPGPQGQPGERGFRGIPGAQGIPGTKGSPGAKGDPGQQGERGIPGAKGDPGQQGERGIPGLNGASADPTLGNRIREQERVNEEATRKIDQVLVGLAAATVILRQLPPPIQAIQAQTSTSALEAAAAAGTCRTTQPGGCTTSAINRGNQDLLNKLGAGAQGADLALLGVINNKLGSQIPGGIGGFLQKAFKATRLDKVINLLTLITTLHNAAMLSRNLASTLGELTGQALSVIGIKDENDSPIDINEQLGKQINEFFEQALGAELWRGIKTSWNKANSVIASAASITYTVRSLWDSSREVLEWTAENTGKIGNSLKRFRVVGENAYRWMPEQVTHQNAWALKVNRFREGTDSLDDAASSLSSVLGEVQNIQEESKDLKEQKERFDKNISDLIPKDRAENTPVATAVTAARIASKAPADAANVFRGEGEIPDAGT